MELTREETAVALDQLIPRPPFDGTWHISEAELLSIQRVLCLHESYGAWAQSPRLYTLLHMLQCDQAVLDQLQRVHINDFWLPINEATLVRVNVAIESADFLRIQHHVLSDPIYMSNIVLLETTQVHRHLQSGEEHLLEMEHINDGASARVFRVKHKASGKVFACKRAPRGIIRFQQDRLRLFLQELDILRRLNHRHIIRLVASYTDMGTFALILHPVADESLKSMLSRPLSPAELSILRQSFGCLISALVYLHEERQVRHKDIKPDNILLDRGRIYLCDFGISLDWSDIGEATTHGKPFQRTIGYCAPEVISWESRNDASDIWSMGRVFCDMITVIKGRLLPEMLEHIGGGLYGIYDNPEAMRTWLLELRDKDSYSVDNLPLAWAQDMIATRPVSRPTASNMAARVLAETPDISLSHTYVAPCCRVHLKDIPSASARRAIMPRSALSLSNIVTVINQTYTSVEQFTSAHHDVSDSRPNSPITSPTQQIDPTRGSARPTNEEMTLVHHSTQRTTNGNKKADKVVEKGLVNKSRWSELYRPGDVVITVSGGDHSASVCISCSVVDADYLTLTCWSWAFDGKFYRREQEIALLWPSSTNEVKISELGCFPLELDESGLAEALMLRGSVFWSCRTKRCISYHPASDGAELHDMRSRYMVDVDTYHRLHPSNVEYSKHSYLSIDLMQSDEPPPGIFALLLPAKIKAFNFHNKIWDDLSVRYIQAPLWNTDLFKSLVLARDKKEMIQALVTTHTKRRPGIKSDLMEGKGNGVSILLYGEPGTGKTFTAESVAELTQRPLYRVTYSDLRTKPETTEKGLKAVLSLAAAWDCVVLLDEADFLLERDSRMGLESDALVSAIAHMLEYHDGIMILATSYLDTIDEAVRSRIQLVVHYPKATYDERLEMWDNFLYLPSEGGDDSNVWELREHLQSHQAPQLNGRQIRNVVATARRLARNRDERLEYGHVWRAIDVALDAERQFQSLRSPQIDNERGSGGNAAP